MIRNFFYHLFTRIRAALARAFYILCAFIVAAALGLAAYFAAKGGM